MSRCKFRCKLADIDDDDNILRISGGIVGGRDKVQVLHCSIEDDNEDDNENDNENE